MEITPTERIISRVSRNPTENGPSRLNNIENFC